MKPPASEARVIAQSLGAGSLFRRGSLCGMSRDKHAAGRVILVGAGPGDPELLTLRAVRELSEADVVVYDHLVSPQVLEHAAPAAERIYVGKESGHHTLPQERINDLLAALARTGRRVVRLKGGDPFVFGRGGEEKQALEREGITCEVVPGVTAACGIAAATGVPLTHRDHAHACVFVTGHLRDGTMDLDWKALARPMQTLVVYMGLKGLGVLAQQLIGHGMAGTTPVMVVERGTLPNQRVVTAELTGIHRAIDRARLKSPALTIVGDVVKCRTDAFASSVHAQHAEAQSA